MASVWIERRWTTKGDPRYRVEFTLGGARARSRYAGSFKTRREALLRKGWVAGELAAHRVPDVRLLLAEPPPALTLREISERWYSSRIDVAEATSIRHRTELNRIQPRLGARLIDELSKADVAEFVSSLATEGYARGTIRKTLQTLSMVLEHAGVENVARGKHVRLPREESEEINPPTAAHGEAVYRLLPSKHRLAFLFLDWSGARVGSIDKLLVGDYDEPRRRIRLRKEITKMRRGVWIDLAPALADALEAALGPREDRDPEARLFADSGADALRTSIGKACRAAGIPLFSPHDLRHRRISLLHLRGVPWARIGEFVGQKSLSVTADTYTHVLADETELDYAAMLR